MPLLKRTIEISHAVRLGRSAELNQWMGIPPVGKVKTCICHFWGFLHFFRINRAVPSCFRPSYVRPMTIVNCFFGGARTLEKKTRLSDVFPGCVRDSSFAASRAEVGKIRKNLCEIPDRCCALKIRRI